MRTFAQKPRQPDKQNQPQKAISSGNTGTNPDVFQIYLSGPEVRKHLATETKIPGRSSGIPP